MSTVAVTNISVDQMKTDLNALLNQRMDGAADGSVRVAALEVPPPGHRR